MTNPFEDENGIYHVLINDEGQYSLWPSFIDVPDGWTIIHKSDSRTACLEFINRNWTDMRPNSLIKSNLPQGILKISRRGRQRYGPSCRRAGRLPTSRKKYQLSSIERSCNVAPLSKCSMKIWPMLRVQAIAVTDETTSPMSAPDGTT